MDPSISSIKNHIIFLNNQTFDADTVPQFLNLVNTCLPIINQCNDYSLWKPLTELAYKIDQIAPHDSAESELKIAVQKVQHFFWGFILSQTGQPDSSLAIFEHVCEDFPKKMDSYIPSGLVCKSWHNLCQSFFLKLKTNLERFQKAYDLKFDTLEQALEHFSIADDGIVNLSGYKELTEEHLKALFTKNKSIKVLYIDDCSITNLPEECAHLILLGCSSNPNLKTLPKAMPNLLFLNCSGCALSSLPTKMTSLQKLFCVANQLTSLPSDMLAIEHLVCRNNSISTIPASFTRLEILDCRYLATLQSLSDQFICLKELWCSYCPELAEIPSYPNLEVLSCHNNPNVQQELYSLPKIKKLKIYESGITKLPDGMVKLETLYCEACPLNELPQGMISLKKIGRDAHLALPADVPRTVEEIDSGSDSDG